MGRKSAQKYITSVHKKPLLDCKRDPPINPGEQFSSDRYSHIIKRLFLRNFEHHLLVLPRFGFLVHLRHHLLHQPGYSGPRKQCHIKIDVGSANRAGTAGASTMFTTMVTILRQKSDISALWPSAAKRATGVSQGIHS